MSNSHYSIKLSLKDSSVLRVACTILVLLLCINLFLLNIWVFKSILRGDTIDVLGAKTTNTKTTATTSGSCPNACVALINKSAGKTVTTTSAKEYFVSFGTGSTTGTDWTDVAGTQATINTASYGKIKQAFFEPTVQNASNQRVWVRLYNVTDKHPVWFSEVTYEGMTATLLTSSPIVLDAGEKVYQVQVKTQLRATATLTQSRIRITTY